MKPLMYSRAFRHGREATVFLLQQFWLLTGVAVFGWLMLGPVAAARAAVGKPLTQAAYLKGSNTGGDDTFGWSVAISGDTVVVGAIGEAGNATGVNPGGAAEADNSAYGSGAAYVFVRDPLGNWTQQAYLKASNNESNSHFGSSVAISGDTVVVGSSGGGSGALGSGSAYVFVRSGTTWSQQAYLKASNAGTDDRFGAAVSVSGDTIVVGAYGEFSKATGVNGDETDNSAPDAGAAYVFVRSGTTWTQQAYLKASNTGAFDYFGLDVDISGDTVVVGAFGEASDGSSPSDDSEPKAGAIYVFKRSGTTWSQQAYLKAGNHGADDWFGYSVAISGDTIVAGARLEDSNATGVNGPDNNSAPDSGAAYVFVRSGTTWSQEAYLKASNTGTGDDFGWAVSISGDTVVVGAQYESSNAIGVNPGVAAEADNSYPLAGAAYVFTRSGTTWSQQAFLKASNTDTYDYFGRSVAVAGDTALVGAFRESSNATGVNGDQSDNSANGAGAVYVFGGPCTDPLRFACAAVTNVFTAGGANDNFAGPEPASPSAGLAGRYSALVGFDECPTTSAIFAHTFSNLPPCITAARVCVRLKPCDLVNCVDEAINFAFVGPASQILPPGYWQSYLGAGNPGPGLIGASWCSVTSGETICLDLAKLPPNLSGGPTDLIAAMNQYGFFDVTAGNESAVDWIRLEVESCCCHPDISVTNDPGQCSAVVNYVPPAAIGGCSSNVTVTCSPPPGSFPVGTTTVTCIASNDAGKSAQCTFRVTVRDAEPPIIICPVSVFDGSNCLIPLITLGITDNCTPTPQIIVQQSPLPNTAAAQGMQPVTITACDLAGNCSTCTVWVDVRGTRERVFSLRTGVDCGVPLAVGVKDVNWTAHGYGLGGKTGIGDATVMPTSEFGPGWVPNSSTSQWLQATGPDYETLGYTSYRTTFFLACTNATITGRFMGNQAARLRLNGVDLLSAGPTAWVNVKLTGPFVVGPNTLDIVTFDFPGVNEGNPGIRAELDGFAECCGLSAPTNATACLPPLRGLTHWYPGDVDARDLTGRNPGRVESGAVAGVSGKVVGAFKFNGVSGGVDLGNVPDLDFTQCSSYAIEAWFNSTGPSAGPDQYIVALNYDSCVPTLQGLSFSSAGVQGQVRFQQRDNSPTPKSVSLFSPMLPRGVFHHVVAVRDASTAPAELRLYVNGVLVDVKADPTTGPLSSFGSDFIGRRFACLNASVFNGRIDEVSFYNRPLSGFEAAQLFATQSNGKCRPRCYAGPTGAIGAWRGDGNAKDSAFKRHGVTVNGTAFAPGAVNQAFVFDGVNDYVNVGYSTGFDVASALTISAWVNPARRSGVTTVIAGRPFGYQLNVRADGRALFAIATGPSTIIGVASTVPLPLDTFVLVTGTYGAGQLRIYLDGVLNNTLALPGAPAIYNPSGKPLQFGGFDDPGFIGGFFPGRIDEVCLWSRALTAAEVQGLRNASAAGKCPTIRWTPLHGAIGIAWDSDNAVLERTTGLGGAWEVASPEPSGELVVPTTGPSGFFRLREPAPIIVDE